MHRTPHGRRRSRLRRRQRKASRRLRPGLLALSWLLGADNAKATIEAEATATQRQQRIAHFAAHIKVRRKPWLVRVDDTGCVAQSRAGHGIAALSHATSPALCGRSSLALFTKLWKSEETEFQRFYSTDDNTLTNNLHPCCC